MIDRFIPLGIIILVAGLTFLMRVFPFVLFGKGKAVPKLVKALGDLLPPAVIAILVVYCLKAIDLRIAPYGFPELLAVVLVIILHLWKRNNLLSIGGGTLIYMLLLQMVF